VEFWLCLQRLFRRAGHDDPVAAAGILGVAELELSIRHRDLLFAHAEETAYRHDHVVSLVVLAQNKVVNASDFFIAIIDRSADQLAGTDITTVGEDRVTLRRACSIGRGLYLCVAGAVVAFPADGVWRTPGVRPPTPERARIQVRGVKTCALDLLFFCWDRTTGNGTIAPRLWRDLGANGAVHQQSEIASSQMAIRYVGPFKGARW
jgi:hypothetical protein